MSTAANLPIGAIVVGVILLLMLIWIIATYNAMVRLRQHCRESWSAVDTELKRRYDLIPNLVETVKGYAAHERSVLQAVVEARTRAVASTGSAGSQAKDENVLVGSLRQLLAVAENYPQLKASDNFLQLQQELANTEDRIQAARRFYNANVRDLNTRIEVIPSSLVAGVFSFRQEEFFEVEDSRVRAAPNTAPTVALIRQPKGAWGFDPNVFVEETDYAVYPWADGATSFQIAEDLTAPEAPGRGVPVVLWEKPSGVDNYLDSPHAYYGSLGQTSGGLTEIAFGLGVVIAASSASTLRLTVIGPRLISAYGWTAEDDAGNETALSPLVLVEASLELPPYQPLYTPEITVPGGPDGTALRHVYRFTWDFGSTGVTAGPWAYLWGDGGWFGGLYDRMMRRIATYDSTEPLAVAGTDPVTIYDEDVSLTTYGTRPPSPLIYTGTITVDSPSPVYLLPPLNL